MGACLAILSLVAVRVFPLRTALDHSPGGSASEVATADEIAVVGRVLGKKGRVRLTVREFVRGVAGLGGFLGRKGDGEPGVRTVAGCHDCKTCSWDTKSANKMWVIDRFEAGFAYPLGPDRTFRIDHGVDYLRFYRSMGDSVCVVAERDGEVLGVLSAVLRGLARPGGGVRPALYLGDLKIAPRTLGGRVLLRLADDVAHWTSARADVAFGVVMGGTRAAPDRYTGRLGLPSFREITRVAVLRVPSGGESSSTEWVVEPGVGEKVYSHLAAGRYTTVGGDSGERSEMSSVWLASPDGSACGRLEDTRRAKRLFDDIGREIVSAHLSEFAYTDPAAGLALLSVARRLAADRGFPAVFTAIPEDDAKYFRAGCRPEVVVAPASVYAAGLEPGGIWLVNTAEI